VTVLRRRPGAARVSRGRGATDSTTRKNSRALPSTAASARAYETVGLVPRGGSALGAYQCSVCEGLDEAAIRPDWFAGISIGAINAAEQQKLRFALENFVPPSRDVGVVTHDVHR